MMENDCIDVLCLFPTHLEDKLLYYFAIIAS